MYYFSKCARGKILHTEGCHHIRRTPVARLGSYGELYNGFYDGFRLCKHCSPLEKCLGRERGMIIDFSLKNGIAVSSDRKGFNIQTLSSLWKITARDSGKGIALYHANQIRFGKSKIKGYHLQGDIRSRSIMGYLDYIVKHDAFRDKNPLCKKKEPAPTVSLPKKGTKRYRKETKKQAMKRRRTAIKNVLNIIDTLQCARAMA